MVYGLQDIGLLRRFIDEGDAPDERRRVEHLKLSALLGYCETTRCRRQVLLEAFGETHPTACGNCDTCLEPAATWEGTEAAQKVLSAVYRTGQRFGQAHVIDVLLGDHTDKVDRFRHDELPTFGVGADLDRRAWQSVIRQLVAAGHLVVDIDGYGGLRLGDDARAVLRGERRLLFRHEPRPAASRRAGRSAVADQIESEEDRELFEALRAKRLELARAQGVPPYVVFSDRSLKEMAVAKPADRPALAAVHGVGEVKLDRYADAFLGVIAAHTAG
jgi:ATP-dependent DNA helicase RecQ